MFGWVGNIKKAFSLAGKISDLAKEVEDVVREGRDLQDKADILVNKYSNLEDIPDDLRAFLGEVKDVTRESGDVWDRLKNLW
jgi:hypothetical protein